MQKNTRSLIPVTAEGRRIGQYHHRAKLSDDQVEEIRVMHEGGMGYRSIARQLKLSRDTVRSICTMRRRACTAEAWVWSDAKGASRKRIV